MSDAKAPRYVRYSTLVWLFILMMSALLLLAWRSQINDAQIEINTGVIAAQQNRQCEVILGQLTTFNRFRAAMIAAEISGPSEPRTAARVAAYKASVLPLPTCPKAH